MPRSRIGERGRDRPGRGHALPRPRHGRQGNAQGCSFGSIAHRDGGGGGDDIAIKDHRHALDPRGKDCACHRGDFTPAKPAQDLKRIGKVSGMMGKRCRYGGDLGHGPHRIDAGSSPDPAGDRAAIRAPHRLRRRRSCCRSPFHRGREDPFHSRSPPSPKPIVAAQAGSSSAAPCVDPRSGGRLRDRRTFRPRSKLLSKLIDRGMPVREAGQHRAVPQRSDQADTPF